MNSGGSTSRLLDLKTMQMKHEKDIKALQQQLQDQKENVALEIERLQSGM